MQPDLPHRSDPSRSLSEPQGVNARSTDGQPVFNRRSLLAGLSVAYAAAVTAGGVGPSPADKSRLVPVNLTCEHLVDPLGIDRPLPRLAWKFENTGGTDRGQIQTAWQIIVASELDLLDPHQCDIWNSGRIESSNSVDISYGGKPLLSHQRCFWRLRVWDRNGAVSVWSKTAVWTMGIVDPSHWVARWVGTEQMGGNWRDYTLRLDFKIRSHAAGVFFRSQPDGDGYMWQINTYGPTPELKEHCRENGGYRVLKQVSLGHILNNADMAHWHTLKIAVRGHAIKTFVNNHLVDETRDDTFATGSIGLREADGEAAEFKNLRVTGPDRRVLLDAPLNGRAADPFPNARPGRTGLLLTGGKAFLGGILRTPMLRREIRLKAGIKRAWIYASALGIYELSLNGFPVSRQLFAPGDTNYYNRMDYQMYDVTHLLSPGANVIGAMLAPGWYCGHIGWFGDNLFGNAPALFMQLHIQYHDAASEVFATDSTWTASPGPVVYADNLNGETYDARLEQPGWNTPGFVPGNTWRKAVAVAGSPKYTRRLAAQMEQPVRAIEEFSCRSVTAPKRGVFVCDLGQLITGVCRLKIRGPAGAAVSLRYGEWLKPDGTLFTENLRAARATDRYTLKGGGLEVFQPRFTFHGFRYIEITGYPGKLLPSDVTGILTVTDVSITGKFQADQPLVNKIQSCIFWTGRDTEFSIPMAVPDRNERLGWAGDINFFSSTAVFNFDLQAFYANWLGDLDRDMTADGIFGNVAPLWMRHGGGYGGGWGDVGICLPYLLYTFYADRDIVRRCWPYMVRNIAFMKNLGKGWILPGNFAPAADWLNVNQATPPDLIATAYWAYDAILMSRMARGIGKPVEAAQYAAMFRNIRAAFQQRFIKPDGTVGNGSQTSYVMALYIGLVPAHLRANAAFRLAANIHHRGNHLATGFVGSQWLLDVLTQTGQHPLACRLIETTTFPSWGYEVARGSTTFWEAWNAVQANGQVFEPSRDAMSNPNSLCAPPLAGSVGDWMYRHIGGISADYRQPGFSHIVIHPRPGGRLMSAAASLNSIRGRIETDWRIHSGKFILNLVLPPNTHGTVYVPTKNPNSLTEGGKSVRSAAGAALKAFKSGAAVLHCQSGLYKFQAAAL